MTPKRINAAFESELAVLPLAALLPLKQVTVVVKKLPNTSASRDPSRKLALLNRWWSIERPTVGVGICCSTGS
jgi:hypothetical protein